MSGKLRSLQLASLQSVEKVCNSFRYLPKLAVSTTYKLQALVVVKRQSSLHRWRSYFLVPLYCLHTAMRFPPGFQNKSMLLQALEFFEPALERETLIKHTHTHLLNGKQSCATPHCYGLWRDGKQGGDVCFHVQWSLDCCVCFSE